MDADPFAGADEHTAPDGTKVWIRKGATMRRSTGGAPSNAKNENPDVVECKKTGMYEVGGARLKFFTGDKMPKGAKLTKGDVYPGGRAAEKLAARADRINAERAAMAAAAPSPAPKNRRGGNANPGSSEPPTQG